LFGGGGKSQLATVESISTDLVEVKQKIDSDGTEAGEWLAAV